MDWYAHIYTPKGPAEAAPPVGGTPTPRGGLLNEGIPLPTYVPAKFCAPSAAAVGENPRARVRAAAAAGIGFAFVRVEPVEYTGY